MISNYANGLVYILQRYFNKKAFKKIYQFIAIISMVVFIIFNYF